MYTFKLFGIPNHIFEKLSLTNPNKNVIQSISGETRQNFRKIIQRCQIMRGMKRNKKYPKLSKNDK